MNSNSLISKGHIAIHTCTNLILQFKPALYFIALVQIFFITMRIRSLNLIIETLSLANDV